MAVPRLDPVEVYENIKNLSRAPFAEQAARFLNNAPSDAAISSLAERNPDRWAQALAIVARFAGYNEKLEVEASVTQRIEALSDGELAAEIARLKTS